MTQQGRAAARRPARVLMLTKGLGRGGAERLIAGTVRHLDPTRYQVEVAYLLPWKDAFVDEIRVAGVPVHCLDARRPVSLGWVRRLRRLIVDQGTDIVHTHMPLPAAVARMALNAPRPIFVHTEHNLWDRYRRPTRWANAATFHRNAAVIAVSESVAASIRSTVPTSVVAHGIDVSAARYGEAARLSGRARLGIDPTAPVIGTVGNFTAKKDHGVLVAAAARLVDEHPDLRVVFIGSGPLEDQLRTLTHRLGLDDTVLFTGSRDDVYDVLPALDVFTLTSRFEGLPIALLEAMASAVPAVATSVGGIPEVISDGDDGILIRPEDPDGLATAVGKLLTDPVHRAALGERARRRAAAFDLRDAVEQIATIYDRVLGSTAMAPAAVQEVRPL